MKVRQALNMAINREAIIEAVFQGAGQTAKNPIPPTMWSYNDDVEDTNTIRKRPRSCWPMPASPNGFEIDLWAMPVPRPYNPNARRMAEMIQADWAKVGVKAKIVSYEWGEYLQAHQATASTRPCCIGWTGDNGDPDNFLYVLLGCAAVGSANRARLVQQGLRGPDRQGQADHRLAERTKLYEQAQVVFKEQAPLAARWPTPVVYGRSARGSRLQDRSVRHASLRRRGHELT